MACEYILTMGYRGKIRKSDIDIVDYRISKSEMKVNTWGLRKNGIGPGDIVGAIWNHHWDNTSITSGIY